MKTAISIVVAVLLFSASGACQALPDLVPDASVANAYVSSENITTGTCAVDEGCTSVGLRRLLRYNAYTKNIGVPDLVMGNPVGNPLFEFHACHSHYHFHDYLEARLTTTTGTAVGSNKQSFCLLDTIRHDPSASTTPLYNCANQGIQAGWGDIYFSTLDCQYIDITGVPAGDYVLELHVNPEEVLVESDYDNNISTVPITITEVPPVPPNDVCTSAIEVQIEGVPLTGNTESASNDGSACGSSSSARDIWFHYTPANSGTATFSMCDSGYDTVLSIHSSCPGTSGNMLACNDDTTGGGCPGTDRSYISFSVTAGTPYVIRVAGYQNSNGVYRLVVTGPPAADVEDWRRFD